MASVRRRARTQPSGGRGFEQGAGPGLAGVGGEPGGGGDFDQAGQREVVADEDDGDAGGVLEFAQRFDDSALDDGVEGGGDFVADEHARAGAGFADQREHAPGFEFEGCAAEDFAAAVGADVQPADGDQGGHAETRRAKRSARRLAGDGEQEDHEGGRDGGPGVECRAVDVGGDHGAPVAGEGRRGEAEEAGRGDEADRADEAQAGVGAEGAILAAAWSRAIASITGASCEPIRSTSIEPRPGKAKTRSTTTAPPIRAAPEAAAAVRGHSRMPPSAARTSAAALMARRRQRKGRRC